MKAIDEEMETRTHTDKTDWSVKSIAKEKIIEEIRKRRALQRKIIHVDAFGTSENSENLAATINEPLVTEEGVNYKNVNRLKKFNDE